MRTLLFVYVAATFWIPFLLIWADRRFYFDGRLEAALAIITALTGLLGLVLWNGDIGTFEVLRDDGQLKFTAVRWYGKRDRAVVERVAVRQIVVRRRKNEDHISHVYSIEMDLAGGSTRQLWKGRDSIDRKAAGRNAADFTQATSIPVLFVATDPAVSPADSPWNIS